MQQNGFIRRSIAALSELWRKAKPALNPYEELDVETLRFKQRNIRNDIVVMQAHLDCLTTKPCLSGEEILRVSELERSIKSHELYLKLCTKALDKKLRKNEHYCKGCLLYERYKFYALCAVLATVANLISFVINIIF